MNDKDMNNSVELLLQQMGPEAARRLRLCAIPHEVCPGILQVLEPNLDRSQAERRYKEISRPSITTSSGDSFALHEDTRRYLFEQWIGLPADAEFVAICQRLVKYFEEQAEKLAGAELDRVQYRRMFHLIGVDQALGFAEFERLFLRMRDELRLNECQCIINLAHEYDRVLEPVHRDLLTHCENNLTAAISMRILTDPECLRLRSYAEKLVLTMGAKALGRSYRDLLTTALAAMVTAPRRKGWLDEADFYKDLLVEIRSVTRQWCEEALRLRDRVWEAAYSLSPAQLIQLKRYAQRRVWKLRLKGHGYDEEDLIQEALTATIEGRRVWREDISFFQHLIFVIKSISWWYAKRGKEYLESDLTEPGEKSLLQQSTTILDPERSLRAKEVLEQIRKLFEEDPEALQVIELLGLKYTAKEIQEELGMSPRKVGATVKRIHRKLNSRERW